MANVASYGSWKSPITSDLIVKSSVGLGGLQIDGEDIYWLEMRPAEKGRSAIVRRKPGGQMDDVIPQPWNARSRVHEYGGGSYYVHHGTVFFSNFADQRIYKLASDGTPQPLTPPVDLRYADYSLDEQRSRLIGIREDHTSGDRDVKNTIVSVGINGADIERGGVVLVSGNDFYANPRVSPDGKHLTWMTWNHPHMPWDGTELWVAELGQNGEVVNARQVAGGVSESIFQPEWSPDGALYFVSDRSGWWNLYRWRDERIENLHPMQAEFGMPQWVFGMVTYCFEDAGRLICSYFTQGRWNLAALDTRSLAFTPIETPYIEIYSLVVKPGKVLFCGATPMESTAIIEYDLATRNAAVLRRSNDVQVDPGYISVAQEIEFPTENGLSAYAFYYPPHNKDFQAPQGELPPLIVKSHGGPTAASSGDFDLEKQYWSSRGFAVVDVNYGGSTGYGREYRERLNGNWGVTDIDDCVNAAKYLVQTGRADPKRLAITGGSAGGYTTLGALAFRKVFQVGACYFGVSDAEALALDTHKFESRYLDGMIGPYPQAKDTYIARSPIHFVDQFDCALILFQGAEDRIVPPDQSRAMYEAVKAKGLPVAYVEYPEEMHGFRKAENIKHSLDSEYYFYARIFGFDPVGVGEPVKIENLYGKM